MEAKMFRLPACIEDKITLFFACQFWKLVLHFLSSPGASPHTFRSLLSEACPLPLIAPYFPIHSKNMPSPFYGLLLPLCYFIYIYSETYIILLFMSLISTLHINIKSCKQKRGLLSQLFFICNFRFIRKRHPPFFMFIAQAFVARNYPLPFNFLFTYLFSIKFLY